MEIDIKIRLEDADIALLIKALWEILKKVPQDNINVKIDPNIKPPDYPQYNPPQPYTTADPPLCGNVIDTTAPCGNVIEYPNRNCPCQLVVDSNGEKDTAVYTDTATTTDIHINDSATSKDIDNLSTCPTLKEAVEKIEEKLFYSNNGESVKKLDGEKKNEV